MLGLINPNVKLDNQKLNSIVSLQLQTVVNMNHTTLDSTKN